MDTPLSVLYLEGTATDSEPVLRALQAQWPDSKVEVVRRRSEFEKVFQKHTFHLVLCADGVAGYGCAQALEFVRARNRDVPFILITSSGGEQAVLPALEQGATDYVLKDGLTRLVLVVTRALVEATERAKLRTTEEALRSAELQYRTLFEQSPYPVVVVDPETTLPLEFNDEACRLMGYSREEFAQLRIADYAAHRNPEQIRARVAAVLKQRTAEFSVVHRRKTGETFDCWVTVRTVQLRGRQVFYTIWRDISEQKRATAELERREEYFRALTELGSDVIAVLGPNGAFRYLSSSVGRVLGYDPDLLMPRNAFDLLHPEDELLARDTVGRLIAAPNAVSKLELRVRHASGAWRVLEIVGRNLLDDPNVAGIIISARDVTERRNAEIRIREQAALLDNAQDAIMVCDLESRLLFWSRSAERVYGWQPREALGENADRLLFGTESNRPVAAFKGLIAKGEWNGELIQVNRKGEQIVVESRWSLVRSDNGRPHSILIINTDVTETRKLQAQFLRAQRMESIGALAGGIAHDLNNILAPILIAAELLREKVGDPECHDWLNTLTDSAQRGADLVRQILSFARGTGEEMMNIQVRHLMQEHVRILKETLPRSIKIETATDKGLWLVKGNATKLDQVLMNLSVNARDAMPAGGRIKFRARNVILDQLLGPVPAELTPGSYVMISVADTGTGIPRQLVNRIFEPFFTTKDVTKGTGLGLATALGIVKSHSGALVVSSEEGKGSQFDIYLPAVHTQVAVAPSPAKVPAPRGAGQCVLVVDDEAPTRDLVRASLQKHGYDVLVAKDGADGLETFMANPGRVSLVITDLEMPVMDGARFVRAVRQLAPTVPVVILSGLIAADPPVGLEKERHTQLMEKPCSAEDLLLAVHRGLTAM